MQIGDKIVAVIGAARLDGLRAKKIIIEFEDTTNEVRAKDTADQWKHLMFDIVPTIKMDPRDNRDPQDILDAIEEVKKSLPEFQWHGGQRNVADMMRDYSNLQNQMMHAEQGLRNYQTAASQQNWQGMGVHPSQMQNMYAGMGGPAPGPPGKK